MLETRKKALRMNELLETVGYESDGRLDSVSIETVSFNGLIMTFSSKSEWISHFCNELLAPTLNYLRRSGMQGSRTSGEYCSTICNIRNIQ